MPRHKSHQCSKFRCVCDEEVCLVTIYIEKGAGLGFSQVKYQGNHLGNSTMNAVNKLIRHTLATSGNSPLALIPSCSVGI